MGATRVHMYRPKHIQEEMILTQTADMLAEIVSKRYKFTSYLIIK